VTKLIAWIVSNGVALGLLAFVALFVLFGVQRCSDKDTSVDAAVMKERIRGDSLKAIGDSMALAETRRQLDQALANGVKVVDRWRESAPRPITTGTPHDTITQLTQQVRACRNAGDSLVQSVVKIQSTCLAYRDTATKTIANLRTIIARKDTLLGIGKPAKRWNLSLSAGYGYGIRLDSLSAQRRAFVGITIGRALWSW